MYQATMRHKCCPWKESKAGHRLTWLRGIEEVDNARQDGGRFGHL